MPALGGYGIAELEGMESQERGFQHGHRKKYAIPHTKERHVIDVFKEKDEAVLHSLLKAMRDALVLCAGTLQYEASTLPAAQMQQTVLPETNHEEATTSIQTGQGCRAGWIGEAFARENKGRVARAPCLGVRTSRR